MPNQIKNITVIGAGYVGMSIATFLATTNIIKVLEVDQNKIKKINNRLSTIKDSLIDDYLQNKKLFLSATSDKNLAIKGSDLIIICLPTDFNENSKTFDTSIIESILLEIHKIEKTPNILIKSTVPVDFTLSQIKKFKNKNILFSPEFLREGSALEDCLNPSRIIFGGISTNIDKIISLFSNKSLDKNTKIIKMSPSEAESVKLFSNMHLAMRVAYFNEIDNFSIDKNLNARNIILGVSNDSRIGNFYNNPSFGFGGYCLPKDTKQLLSSFNNESQSLVTSVLNSNELRKNKIVKEIISIKANIVGIHRLSSKKDSDNYRNSPMVDIILMLADSGVIIKIFEPLIKEQTFLGFKVIADINEFKEISDLIICNRMSTSLEDCIDKVYTRDIFNSDI
jgi:UDPglucose 6-dehydrogenase